MQPEPGRVVAGRYRLERQLAVGGVGTVWVARHVDLDVDVAVKFMADEVAGDTLGQNHERIDLRSDLWSFGVVIFEMLTGCCPFEEEHLGQFIRAVTTMDAPSVRDHVEDLPPGLDAFFGRALSKVPTERHASARQMADAYRAAIGVVPAERSRRQVHRGLWSTRAAGGHGIGE